MPPQKRIISDVTPQFAGRSLAAAEAPGEAAARLGDNIATIGEQMLVKQKQLEQSRQLMQYNSMAEDAAQTLYQGIATDPNVDSSKLADTVKTGLQKVHDTTAKNIKDSEVRIRFDQNFERIADQHLTNARNLQFSRQVDDYKAGLNTSLDTIVRVSASHDMGQLISDKSQITGMLNNAVAHGAMTKVEAQKELESRFGQIDHSQALMAIQADPANAARLLRDGNWEGVNPVQRETLAAQADRLAQSRNTDAVNMANRLEAAAKAQQQKEADTALAKDRAAADEGTLSHDQLANDRIKYAGFWPEAVGSVLYDKINGSKEKPSVATVHNDVGVRIGQWPPTIAEKELDSLHDSGQLNGTDWMKYRTELANKNHQLDRENKENPTISQQWSMAGQNLRLQLGNTDAYPAAVEELNKRHNTGTISDPLAAGKDVIDKFKPNAVDIRPFTTAMTKFKSSATQLEMAQFTHMVKTELMGNPREKAYSDARDILLQEAEKAHRIVGNDSSGSPDGTHRVKDGKSYMVIGGKVILE